MNLLNKSAVGMRISRIPFIPELMHAVANICKDEGTPFSVWMGPMLVIGIARPEDMQTVLSSSNCLQKGYMYKFVHNTTGIFSSDGMIFFKKLNGSRVAPANLTEQLGG